MAAETIRGYETVRLAEDVLGLMLMPWQKWVLVHGLELNADGTFRSQDAAGHRRASGREMWTAAVSLRFTER